jgi:TPR repeat protein
MRWYRVASDLGQADAMGALGRLLLQQPEASAEASRLLQQAAQLGDTTGQYYLGWLLVQRNAETSDAGQAYAWFSKAAAQGHLGAQVAVAVHLLEGRGVGKDVKIARQWLERAAEKQDPIAHYLLARLSGDAGQGGLDKARSSFRIAATAGHREAQFALATILAESMVEADRNEAAEWFAKADEAGHKAAANSLGELYRDGRVLRQMERARSIFQRAAEHGDANAMYNLAHMLNMGLGGPQDTVGALKWYARAAEEGHEKALETVSDLLDSSLKTSALGLRGFWQ